MALGTAPCRIGFIEADWGVFQYEHPAEGYAAASKSKSSAESWIVKMQHFVLVICGSGLGTRSFNAFFSPPVCF